MLSTPSSVSGHDVLDGPQTKQDVAEHRAIGHFRYRTGESARPGDGAGPPARPGPFGRSQSPDRQKLWSFSSITFQRTPRFRSRVRIRPPISKLRRTSPVQPLDPLEVKRCHRFVGPLATEVFRHGLSDVVRFNDSQLVPVLTHASLRCETSMGVSPARPPTQTLAAPEPMVRAGKQFVVRGFDHGLIISLAHRLALEC